ncbi:hypothetical protein GCWU000324_02123 [Kingella oralis ATCC 51147]|uniref:Uncharacterized protein n=1 Tax=Kingella oralis ATCC 51147 TaxID=629741 RepID=C4GJA0_9NEIS|nr:hypothetical protein GCWU000324_02123 [Kingella oralis ATCC 51147]
MLRNLKERKDTTKTAQQKDFRLPFYLPHLSDAKTHLLPFSGCRSKIAPSCNAKSCKMPPFFTTQNPTMDDLPSSTFTLHHSTPIN